MTGNTIATDGDGTFTGTLTISGDTDTINAAGGLRIAQKNDADAEWTYGKGTYILTWNDQPGNYTLEFNDGTLDIALHPLNIEYTNTHSATDAPAPPTPPTTPPTTPTTPPTTPTTPTTPPTTPTTPTPTPTPAGNTSPQTGDDSHTLLWMAGMAGSCVVIAGLYLRKKMTRTE